MGKRFTVEPIETKRPPAWGDMRPDGTGISGNYGKKHAGAVSPEASVVTEENGFENIVTLPAGQSPMDYINSQK